MKLVVNLHEAERCDNDQTTLEREEQRLLTVLRQVDDTLLIHRRVHCEDWDDFVLPYRALERESELRQAISFELPTRYELRLASHGFMEIVRDEQGDGWPRQTTRNTLVVRRRALPKRAPLAFALLALFALGACMALLIT